MRRTRVLLSVVGLFTLVLGQPAQAGVIDVRAALTALPPFDPVPPFGIVATEDGVQVSGNATSISGFHSLAGVTPADLTFTITGLKFDPGASFTRFPITGTFGVTVYHGSPAMPALLDFSLSGTPIAEFTGLFVRTQEDFSMFFSSGIVTATPAGSGTLDSLYTSAFSREVLKQTGGTGIIQFQADPFNSFEPSLPDIIPITGSFSTVPEPGTLALLSIGVLGLLAYRSRGAVPF
jgi:hypothetical protein